MKLLYLFLFLFVTPVNSQSDSVFYDPSSVEDLLPVVNNEGRNNDYLEEEESDNFLLALRSRYQLNPDYPSPKVYNRVRSEYSQFSAGAITEKDAGENNITDFYSYYVSFLDTGFIRQAIIGNYNYLFGCGLVSGSNYKVYKTSDPFSPLNKNNSGLKHYNSTDENRFYRGAAINTWYRNFNINAFYSQNRFDASVDTNGVISYIPLTGLHITRTELLRKKAGAIESAALSSGYYSKDISAAIFYSRNKSDKNFSSSLALKHEYDNLSLFIKLPLNNEVIFTTETASDLTYTNSIYILSIAASRGISYISSVRLYRKKFSSFYSGSFSESGSNKADENGFYNGCRIRLMKLTLSLYYDFYKVSGESSYKGNELMLKGEYRFTSQSFLRIKFRSKENINDFTGSTAKKNISFEFGMPVPGQLFYRVKGEAVSYSENTSEKGYMLYNDFQLKKERYLLEMRVTLFKCPASSVYLYQYERDLPGIFSSKVLIGEGFRWFIYSSYDLLKNIAVSFKYSSVHKKSETLHYINLQADLRI